MRAGSSILPLTAAAGALALIGVAMALRRQRDLRLALGVDARVAATAGEIRRFNASCDSSMLELDASPARPATPPLLLDAQAAVGLSTAERIAAVENSSIDVRGGEAQ